MGKIITIIIFLVLLCFSCVYKKKQVISLLTNDNAKYWTYYQQYKQHDTIDYYVTDIFYYFDTKNVWKTLTFIPDDLSSNLIDSYPPDLIPCNDYLLLNDSVLTLCHREFLIKYISKDSLVIESKDSNKIDIYESIEGVPSRRKLKRLHNYQIVDKEKN